jgi:hypothetical protein
MPFASGVQVVVSRSTDGGLTWGNPVLVGARATTIDKEWIVCDNHAASTYFGRCYLEWNDIADSYRIKMSTSADGGATWSTPVNTTGNAEGFAGQPVVEPKGRVVVPILSPDAKSLLVFDSSNGGDSWSNTSTISPITDHEVAGGLRSEPIPSAEIDAAGTIYVAWHDCTFRAGCPNAPNDIVLATTTPTTYPNWSVTRVPIDVTTSTVDHFIPGLGVDSTAIGHLALAYYFYPDANCTGATCQLDVGFITSVDGGTTWSAASQIAGPMSLSWLPDTTGGLMVGDYISTSFSNGVPHPFFALAHAPSNGSFDEAIYTR